MLPNLIIGGVFKAGTTSLFTYMSEHPEIGVSSKKELGYFIPLQFDHQPEALDEYTKYFDHIPVGVHQHIMEASPGYLYGGEKIAKYMQDLLGNYKIIFILRKPKERLISFYKYLKTDYLYTYSDRLSKEQKEFIENMSFNDYQLKSLNYLKSGEIDESSEYLLSGIKYSLYADSLKEWFNILNDGRIKVINFEDLKTNPHAVLNNLCDWLEISKDIYDNYHFKVQNQTIEIKNSSLHKLATYINRKFEFYLRKNLRLKEFLKQCYYFINKKEAKEEQFELNTEVKELFNTDWERCKKWIETSHSNDSLDEE